MTLSERNEAIEYIKRQLDNDYVDVGGVHEENEIQIIKEAISALLLINQIRWERDVALEQLEELGLSLGQKTEYANVVPREQYEELREAFVDYVCSGVINQAPYCKNRCDECVDNRGWCTYQKCRGFNPDGRVYDED